MDHAAASVMPLLRRGVDAGLWTLEDLDVPSAGWKYNLVMKVADYPKGPVREIPYYGKQHRNLLRDHHPEAVQAGPSPRDFEPAQADPEPVVRSAPSSVHVPGEDSADLDDFCPEF